VAAHAYHAGRHPDLREDLATVLRKQELDLVGGDAHRG
jgi:hypothetical protein